MSDLTTQINEMKAVAIEGITAVQARIDDVKGKVDAIDNDMIKKAAEDVASAIQQLNEMKAADKAAELDARLSDLEKSVAHSAPQGNENKASDEDLIRYVRKGAPLPQDRVDEIARDMARKHLFGATETEIEIYRKDFVSGVGPQGGYFIPADRSNTIMKRIYESSPLRAYANVQTTVSNELEVLLDDDEISAGWIGEVSTRSDTNSSQIGMIRIPVHEVYAMPKATQRMLDDAGRNIESWIMEKGADKLGRTENTSFVVGDGSQKPKGFLSYAAWTTAGTYERNKVEQIESASSGTFTADDVIGLKYALLEAYQANAAFGMKRSTFTDVMKLKGSDGQYLLDPRVLMNGGDKMLLGADVVFMDDIPKVAASALAMVCADFREFYTIVDRFDMRLIRDELTQKGAVKFHMSKRTGGAVTNFEAGKILKIKA